MVNTRVSLQVLLPAWLLLALVVAGCDSGKRDIPPEPEPEPLAEPRQAGVFGETIGAAALMVNVQPQMLRGYGVVVGLDGRGSSDCPTAIREYLIDHMNKQLGPQSGLDAERQISPAELIDSEDTAVVEVRGMVPAGALRGLRFDLQVQAVPGTATESLEGGVLMPTPLRVFDVASSGRGLLAGSVLADGGGPVFVNPFVDPEQGSAVADPREGYVLGGGQAIVERSVRLMLLRPNYQMAKAMERRLNERFGQRPPTAEAVSRGYLTLNTPPAYAREPARFRAVVLHMLVDRRPASLTRAMRDLDQVAKTQPQALEDVALCWEAMGRNVLEEIRPFYAHEDATLRYYAARTGVRLGDLQALPVLGQLAQAARPELRVDAVEELGRSNSPQVAVYVAPLLDDENQEVRIAAYETLLRRGHPAIKSVTLPHRIFPTQINFVLDIVDSDGPPLVYVRRTRLPRIAVFGESTPVTPPVFYTRPDEIVTVHTVSDSADVQLYGKRNGRMSEHIVVPPRVTELVTALGDVPTEDPARGLRGLGLTYSRVVQALAALCEEGTIPARLVLEQASLRDLLGPEVRPERPEAETERRFEGEAVPDEEPPPEARPEAETPESDLAEVDPA